MYCIVLYLDNPLQCSCELTWFPKLLQDLKNKDDEMAQKKKPVCHMPVENREYYVQAMPLEKMQCAGVSASAASDLLDANGVLLLWRLLPVNMLVTFLCTF